jgi:hypothetical protein
MRQINILPAPKRDERKVAEMTKRGHRVLCAGLFPAGGDRSPKDFLNRETGEPRKSLLGTGAACFASFEIFAVHWFFHASLRKSLIFMLFSDIFQLCSAG